MAGNKNSGGIGSTAKRGTELVGRTRGAILNAFDCVERRNKPLSEILADEFLKNPLKFMDMAAKYIPKNVDIEVIHKADADKLSDAELADIIAKRARQLHDEKALEVEYAEVSKETGTD